MKVEVSWLGIGKGLAIGSNIWPLYPHTIHFTGIFLPT